MRGLLCVSGFVILVTLAFLIEGCGDSDQNQPPVTSGYFVQGSFAIEVAEDGALSVSHASLPERVLFSTPVEFVQVWQVDDALRESNGSVTISEQVQERCDAMGTRVITEQTASLVISTTLSCPGGDIPTTITLAPRSGRALGLTVRITPPAGSAFDQVVLVPSTVPDERFVGFGEQFTYVNLRGQAMPIVVQEGGIGRTDGTVRDQVEQLAPGSGGSFYSTYAPMPYYFTDRGRALLLENEEVSYFDLTGPDSITVRVRGPELRAQVLFGAEPIEIVTALSDTTGRMQPLPDWIQRGAIVGMQGGTERVREVLAQLQEAGTPVAGFWLQDWVGKRQTPLGSRLWWNWQLNQTQYPSFGELVSDLSNQNIRVLTYINPYLVNVEGDPAFTRNLYAEARDGGYLVLDGAGVPYVHVSGTFEAGLLDLTDEEAVQWYKQVIRDELLAVGASGYMADFGEALAFDSVTAHRQDPYVLHNQWPVLWAQLNHELLQEQGLLGEVVFFTRAGFTRSPGLSSLFWTGDQMVGWDEFDGMASALTGLLTSGLSGTSLNHSDIGGYTSYGDIVRSEELLLRWIEWSAFTTLFRTHEGNTPEANAQIYSSEAALAQFTKFARLYAALAPYRKTLMQQAATTGAPLVRHLLLEYPRDPRAWEQGREFMLGSDVLVAPVFAPGANTVSVYIPEGRWVHLYSGQLYETSGSVEVDAPIGEPAVFYRDGSSAGQALRAEVAAQ
jgi:alpha-glucosidase